MRRGSTSPRIALATVVTNVLAVAVPPAAEAAAGPAEFPPTCVTLIVDAEKQQVIT
jgi:hypothetical protein